MTTNVLNFPLSKLPEKVKRVLTAIDAQARMIQYMEDTGGWYDLETFGFDKYKLRELGWKYLETKGPDRIRLAQKAANDSNILS